MMPQSIDKKKNIYLYLFLFFLLSTIYNFNIKNFFEKNFTILNIDTNDDLIVLELKDLINQNILNLNKNDIINILEKYPILDSFKINKAYPNTIKMELNRTRHLAKIIHDGKIFYIGKNGKLFKDIDNEIKVPIIQGNVKLELANKFLSLIDKSYFDLNEINFLVFYPSGRWDIILSNNKTIRLPKKNVFKFIQKSALLLKDHKINEKIIDLRINNKIILSDE